MRRSLAIVALMLLSCKSGGKASPAEVDAKGNAFARSLYGRMYQDQGKMVVAPAPLALGLGLAWEGAKGETADQIGTVLHIDKKSSPYGQLDAAEELWSAPLSDKILLKAANQLWLDKSLALNESFKKALSARKASAQQVDFANALEPSRETINRWAGTQTNGKITEVIWKGGVDTSTRALLTSVAYFAPRWRTAFNPARTKMVPFEHVPGSDGMVATMAQTATLAFADLEALQVLVMPCASGDVEIVLLLPKKGHNVTELEKSLANGQLNQWIGQTSSQQLEVYLPKFTLVAQFGMVSILTDLGMNKAFGLDADFSNMVSNPKGVALMVVHQAVVEIGEGTGAGETAPATPPAAPQSLPKFAANHPFVFAVRHQKSGTLLFVGRVTRPWN